MKRNGLYILLAVLTITALLAGCKPATPPTTVPTEEAPPGEETEAPPEATEELPPAEPKIVTIAWTQEPDSLNPLYTNMWYSSVMLMVWNCYAWQGDDTNTFYPHLVTEIPSAENGGISEDGLVITMHLRDDIVWSDGTPITADDFIFTYDMTMDPVNAVDSMYPYDQLASIEAPDAQTIVMTFSAPFASWQATFWTGLLPKHILQPVYDADGSIENADFNMAPTVGCGPFIFDTWESGSFISFTKNENYWLGAPKLDQVVFQFVPDDAAQTAACIAGDVDLGYWPPYSDIPALRDAGLSLVTQASGYNEGWFINFRDMASPAIRDVNVRQAIAMSLDRTTICEDLKYGLVTPNETFWDAFAGAVDPAIEPFPYDPEGAMALLEAAGWTDTDGDGIREDADGNKLTITQGNTDKQERMDLQAVAQQQLLAVGIDLQTEAINSDILFESFTNDGPAATGALDIMEWSDAPYFPDPDTDYWLCDQIPTADYPTGYNYYGCDEDLDALFRQQLVTVNAEERMAIFQQITKLMHDNVYYIGMWEDPDIWIVNPRLTGAKFSGISPFYNIYEWDLTQ